MSPRENAAVMIGVLAEFMNLSAQAADESDPDTVRRADSMAAVMATVGNVWATLALAEEQRIANLTAIVRNRPVCVASGTPDSDNPVIAVDRLLEAYLRANSQAPQENRDNR